MNYNQNYLTWNCSDRADTIEEDIDSCEKDDTMVEKVTLETDSYIPDGIMLMPARNHMASPKRFKTVNETHTDYYKQPSIIYIR